MIDTRISVPSFGAVSIGCQPAGTGGTGGGGQGNYTTVGDNGSANLGAGAGGGGNNGTAWDGGNGGSGIVILKYPDIYTATFSGGVTQSTPSPSGGYKISTVTAAGVSDTVSWA